MKNTIQISLKNRGDGLGRLIGVFRRRGFQIESLYMTIDQADSMNIVVDFSCNPLALQQMVQHINKLIDVMTVEVVNDDTAPAEIYMPAHQSA